MCSPNLKNVQSKNEHIPPLVDWNDFNNWGRPSVIICMYIWICQHCLSLMSAQPFWHGLMTKIDAVKTLLKQSNSDGLSTFSNPILTMTQMTVQSSLSLIGTSRTLQCVYVCPWFAWTDLLFVHNARSAFCKCKCDFSACKCMYIPHVYVVSIQILLDWNLK
jgi:hypothetical protein